MPVWTLVAMFAAVAASFTVPTMVQAAQEKPPVQAAPPVSGVATVVPDEPRITLWSWAGPEDLRFVDPTRVGVAFLAGTIVVNSDSIDSRPRRRELQVAAGTRLTAVVRIETASRGAHIIAAARQRRIAEEVLALANGPGISELQIDFDARVSERTLYRELLAELRRRLRPPMRLSMTALASWCLGDPWLSGLPVDRAVPMIFRMGNDEGRVRTHLASGTRFTSSLCREDIGISTDEPFPKLPSWARIWVFHPKPWNATTFHETLTAIGAQ